MAATFDEIGIVTADGPSTSMELTGIDQTYDDLQVILEVWVVDSGTQHTAYLTVNGETGTAVYNSDMMFQEGNGSWTYQEDYNSYSGWRLQKLPTASSGISAVNGNMIIDMMQYTATRTKSFLIKLCTFRPVGSNSAIGSGGLGYNNTSAISSLTLTATSNFGSGSTMSVYGITNS